MKNNKETILVIEDEPDIFHLIKFHLHNAGYQIIGSKNGEKGLEKAIKYIPDLILLDLMLPGINGLEVTRVLKNDKILKTIPIIMVTALGQEEDIVKGLEIGAIDYISKPFSFPVLVARIKAGLNRGVYKKSKGFNIIEKHNIAINLNRREVKIENIICALTFSEFEILAFLMSNPGWVFTRYQIIKKIRRDNVPVTDRSIDFQIVGLRKKMRKKGKLIETIRGVGYRFKENES